MPLVVEVVVVLVFVCEMFSVRIDLDGHILYKTMPIKKNWRVEEIVRKKDGGSLCIWGKQQHKSSIIPKLTDGSFSSESK